MNNLTFVVEGDSLPQFVEIISENDLQNEIIGQQDHHYLIDVEVEDENEKIICELLEISELMEEEYEELETDD